MGTARVVQIRTVWYALVLWCAAGYGFVRLCTALYGSARVRFCTVWVRVRKTRVPLPGTVLYGSVRLGTVGYGWVRLGTVGYGWVRLGTVGYGWVRGWVRLGTSGTVEYGFVRFGTVLYSCTALYGCMGYVLYIRLKGTHVGTGMYRWVRLRMGLYGSLWVCAGLYWSVRVSMGTDNYI